MKNGEGRHGGNQGRTDRNEAEQAKQQAGHNTDVDSLTRTRDQDEAEGHTSGKEWAMEEKRNRGIAGSKQNEDLKHNPDIGQSVGTSQGGDVDLIEGENTVEGDIDNNAGRFGQMKKDMGRTNK